jgi:hypothetical protein
MDELQRRKLFKAYLRNEDNNYHTKNAVMLIRQFGSSDDKAEAEDKYEAFKRRGYQTPEDSDWFYKKGHSHYSKLV